MGMFVHDSPEERVGIIYESERNEQHDSSGFIHPDSLSIPESKVKSLSNENDSSDKQLSFKDFISKEEIKDIVKNNLEKHFNKVYLQKDRIKSLIEEMYKPLIKQQVEKATDEVIRSKYISYTTGGKAITTILDDQVDKVIKEEIKYYLKVFVNDHLKIAAKDYVNDNIKDILASQDFKGIIGKLFQDEDYVKALILK
jgi:hypothetical protein